MAHFKAIALIKPAAVATLSALALSGCSWLGGNDHGAGLYAGAEGGSYGYTAGQAYGGPQNYAAPQGPASCQIPSANHPVPAGCDPAAVTIGVGSGFAQQAQFGAVGSPAFASGGYGSQLGGSGLAPIAASEANLRKPTMRGFIETSLEKSVNGEYLDYESFPEADPSALLVIQNEGTTSINNSTGVVTTNNYSPEDLIFNAPTISNDDVHATPFGIKGGLEFIAGPRTTLFGSAGYTYAEGNAGNAVTVDATLIRTETQEITNEDGDVEILSTNRFFVPNVEDVAAFAFEFSDMRRIDLQAGARQYFDGLDGMGYPGVSPFVGASAGASHYNAQSFKVTQNQAFLQQAYEAGEAVETYISNPVGITTDIYDSQWVPSGELNAGLEWQANPAMAFAVETGVRVKGGRKYTNGEREGADVAIPFTLRGSYNF